MTWQPATPAERHERARSATPAIEVNQRWVARDDDGTVLRRMRMLAPHPDEGRGWIFTDEPTGNIKRDRYRTGELSTCPEYNLRFVCELETRCPDCGSVTVDADGWPACDACGWDGAPRCGHGIREGEWCPSCPSGGV